MATVISFQYKNDEPLAEGLSCTKTISLQDNGFCLALYSAESKQVQIIEQHDYEPECTLKEKILSIQEAGKKLDAQNAVIICSTHINSQVPKHLHDEKNMDLYLPLLTQEPYNYQVHAEYVPAYELYNISGWDKALYLQLKDSFPHYQLRSKMAVLLEKLPLLTGERKLLLFMEQNYMYLAAAKGENLLGANGFSFNGKNDFLYFLVGFAQTLFGGLEGVDVHLMGNMDPTSLLYSSMQKYFEKIHFADGGYTVLQHQIHRFCDLLCESTL